MPFLPVGESWQANLAAALYVVITAAVFPAIEIVGLLLFYRGRLFDGLKSLISKRMFISVALGGAVCWLMIVGATWLLHYPSVVDWVFVALAFTVGSLPFAMLAAWLPGFVGDRQRFLDATSATALSRASIASDFTRFKTEWYRSKYAEWLGECKTIPTDAWSEKRPNHKDDRASAMLARLDERWLGLDA